MTEFYDPETYPKEWNYLQSGTIIDQYIIERELAHGGFSSVYLARQKDNQFQVAIKEYLPRKLAHRTRNNIVVANSDKTLQLFKRGRALFFEEAKVLATLKHEHIVEVTNFFQENSTVYMVMTYDYGDNLDKLLTEKRITITEERLVSIFCALLNGVEVIHQHNLVHLDIKPANILIRPGYNPLLLDFGAIEEFPTKEKRNHSKVLTKGYSPIEQFSITGNLGPWSDIYAVGATMRTCLDRKMPPDAQERAKEDTLIPAVKAYKRKYPDYLLQAIDWATEIEPKKRPQSVSEFRRALNCNS